MFCHSCEGCAARKLLRGRGGGGGVPISLGLSLGPVCAARAEGLLAIRVLPASAE